MEAWSPKFGWGPGPRDRSGMGWSCLCLGYKYIGSRITVSVRRYDLAMVLHRRKNWEMKDGEMVLIAQPLLESRTCAYLEWLANEVIMTTN